MTGCFGSFEITGTSPSRTVSRTGSIGLCPFLVFMDERDLSVKFYCKISCTSRKARSNSFTSNNSCMSNITEIFFCVDH